MFIGAYTALTLISYILDRIFHLPFLNAANKFGGLLMGILCAYIVMSTASTLITVIAVLTEGSVFGVGQAELASQTFVYGFLNDYGAFDLIGTIFSN